MQVVDSKKKIDTMTMHTIHMAICVLTSGAKLSTYSVLDQVLVATASLIEYPCGYFEGTLQLL